MMELNDPRLDIQQAEKLKVAKWWRDEWRMMMDEWGIRNEEGWRLNDERWWFLAVEGFWFMTDEWMDGRMSERTFVNV